MGTQAIGTRPIRRAVRPGRARRSPARAARRSPSCRRSRRQSCAARDLACGVRDLACGARDLACATRALAVFAHAVPRVGLVHHRSRGRVVGIDRQQRVRRRPAPEAAPGFPPGADRGPRNAPPERQVPHRRTGRRRARTQAGSRRDPAMPSSHPDAIVAHEQCRASSRTSVGPQGCEPRWPRARSLGRRVRGPLQQNRLPPTRVRGNRAGRYAARPGETRRR